MARQVLQQKNSILIPLIIESFWLVDDLHNDRLVLVADKPTLSFLISPRLLNFKASRLDLCRRRIRCRCFLPSVFRSAPRTCNELQFPSVVLKFVLRYFQQLAYLHARDLLRPEPPEINSKTLTLFG